MHRLIQSNNGFGGHVAGDEQRGNVELPRKQGSNELFRIRASAAFSYLSSTQVTETHAVPIEV
jgi:hypothetical protein